jgi:hypothetical protein
VRKFSIRPTLTLKGRKFNGLRGWAGKPLHPPLTDIPITAYFLAAVFDVISAIGGKNHAWAGEFWHAGTFCFVAGVAASVFAALTGLWDAWKSSEAGTQARRTINTHATIMISVTVLAVADRGAMYDPSAVFYMDKLAVGPAGRGTARVVPYVGCVVPAGPGEDR